MIMDYEKKYKESMAKMSTFLAKHDGFTISKDGEMYKELSEIFPELKESEDERMMRVLIGGLKSYIDMYSEWYDGVSTSEIIAWLEKKGEQKLYVNDNAKEMFIKALERVEEQNNKGYKLTDCDKNSWWEDFKNYTFCTIEQNPADKVEPKFCDGDWVVYCNDDVDLITGIEENGYRINNGGYIPFICENEMRLWDITDAKVGDVLVSESTCGLGTWYCIFKSLDGDESMTVYCYLTRDGRFETKKELCFDKDPYNTKPATKEQIDTLMKVMADAGYTFDFDKKELKKIEQKPAWGEEDIELLDNTIKFIEDSVAATPPSLRTYIPTLTGKEIPFLKALKDRVQPKQEWSEEDKWMLQNILECLRHGWKKLPTDILKYESWLKSLRPQSQWRPSDEQIEILNMVLTNESMDDNIARILRELREQLKKLKD